MKKIFLVFILFFSVFALAACSQGGSELDLNFKEVMDAPTNLTINGTVLSWNAVSNAKGYIVYANDEQLSKVSTNKYDFSSKLEDKMIFKVVTQAPRGMQDSPYSVTVAYVKNKEQQISAVEDYMFLHGMDVSRDFVVELVNKGMVVDDVEIMMDSLEALMYDMESDYDMQSLFVSLSDAMEGINNVEAIISASVKTLLPEIIDSEIYELEQQQAYYQAMIDDNWVWDPQYYQSIIDDLQDQIDALKDLKREIRTNPDQIVRSALIAIEYVMSIQKMINDDLISTLSSLLESEELQDINVDEFIQVKDEMVQILRETMPELKDMTVLVKTMNELSEIISNMQDVEVYLPTSAEKTAGQMLMSMEAYINFIDTIDKDFVQTIKDIDKAKISDYHKQAQAITLAITYFDRFKDNNQKLLDQINDIYTDEQKETLYNQYIDYMEDAFEDLDYDMSFSFMTYDTLMKLEAIFQDAFDEILDAFVKSEGEILNIIADMNEYNEAYYDKYYFDRDYDEFRYLNQVYRFKIFDQAVYLLNSVVSERSKTEYALVSDFVIRYMLEIGVTYTNLARPSDYQEFKDDFMEFYNSTTTEQYNLIKNIASYFDKNNYFLDYATSFENTYEDDYDLMNDEEMYFALIQMAIAYDDLMTRTNKRDINKMIDALEVLVQTDLIDDNLDTDDLADNLRDLLAYLDTVAKDISKYDASNLSRTQKATIDDVMDEIEDIFTK